MFEGATQAYTGVLEGANRRANNLVDQWAAHARKWESHAKILEQKLAEAEAENERLKLALLIERAQAAGMKAYRDELRNAHPNSPVLADSGQRYKTDGSMKPRAALAYEAAFDRILKDGRVSNPEKYRFN